MPLKTVDELLDAALTAFDDISSPVSDHVRRAIRITSMRNDYLSLIRLLRETQNLTLKGELDDPLDHSARASLAILIGEGPAAFEVVRITERYFRDRSSGNHDDDTLMAISIGEIEEQLRVYDKLDADFSQVHEGLAPLDAGMAEIRNRKAKEDLLPMRLACAKILSRTKQVVYSILVDTERQIREGKRIPNVFERAHDYITRSLVDRAPKALAEFSEAEAALSEATPERLAQALTSCRRMIKFLADALYPPTNESVEGADGAIRIMTDDSYINRLLQFASDSLGKRTHGQVVKVMVKALGDRLRRLNELASKGVHDTVTITEAESCIMWTYLTVADILRIADGSIDVKSASPEDVESRNGVGGNALAIS